MVLEVYNKNSLIYNTPLFYCLKVLFINYDELRARTFSNITVDTPISSKSEFSTMKKIQLEIFSVNCGKISFTLIVFACFFFTAQFAHLYHNIPSSQMLS